MEDEKEINDAKIQIHPESNYIDLIAPQKEYYVANYMNGKEVDFYETTILIRQN